MNGQSIWMSMLQIAAVAIVVVIVYNFLKKYLLHKIKVNKWVILVLALFSLFLPGILLTSAGINTNGTFWQYLSSGIAIMFILWFLDLMGFGAYRARSNTASKSTEVIKPKAKPNRVKNSDMEVITIKKDKKNKK